MKIIKGDLILKEDYILDDDLKVMGNIICEEGPWDIEARDIKARDIKAWDIKARDIKAEDIKAWDIEAEDIEAEDIEAEDIEFWAVCYARNNFVCKSIKGRRKKNKYFCLDNEVKIIR